MRGDRYEDLADGELETDAVMRDEIAIYGTNTVETALLMTYDVRAAFRRLTVVERVVVALLQRYAVPPGYQGPWPPTPEQVGEYLRITFPEFGGQMVPTRVVITLNRIALQQLQDWLEREGGYHAS